MSRSPLAGRPAPQSILVDPSKLEREYYERRADLSDPAQLVSFGTSGHRGTSLNGSFTEAHIAATVQAVCEYRAAKKVDGPLYLGKDTHALSSPAQRTAIEVLAANGVNAVAQENGGVTPTPVISHAILTYNRNRGEHCADGIVITPSHNPPEDGGIKYNPPQGGPADTDITQWVQDRANALMREGNAGVMRIPYERALKAACIRQSDLITPYVADLDQVVDIAVIRNAGLKLGADPLGGAALPYWEPIAERWGLDITVVNTKLDPQFGFMTVDHDGKIRMDCSSADAMANLIGLKDQYAVAFGNDPDADRHGIVARSTGLLNPNHYLSVAIHYLFTHRQRWSTSTAIGKTLVSSAMIDRVGKMIGRTVYEVPVGFKWFVDGLVTGKLGFGGEESAGASFLRFDGSVWTTDKDGIILDLLAAEITAVTGKDPGQYYQELTKELGSPLYKRVDQPCTAAERAAFKKLTPELVTVQELAGEAITDRLVKAPANGAAIGGLKIVAKNGWFAARPSGTENIYKIYAESFKDGAHLNSILEQAREIVGGALK